MSAFYIGSGGFDVSNITTFFGIPGDNVWERIFHYHHPQMMKYVKTVTQDVMVEAI